MVLLLEPEKKSLLPSAYIQDRRRRLRKYTLLNCAIILSFFLLYKAFYWSEKFDWDRRLGRKGGRVKGYEHESKKHIGAERNRRFERLFLSLPDAEQAINTSRAYTAHAHLAGSEGDYSSALAMLDLFQDSFAISPPPPLPPINASSPPPPPPPRPIFPAGSAESRNATLSLEHLTAPTAWIDVYYPLLNTPLERRVQILGEGGEVIWEADLREYDGEGEDEDEGEEGVPAFHGLSMGGDVTGDLVYAGYALPEDFARLREEGVDFAGKIVLAKYGENYRGMKVKAAAMAGASALILFSSPTDDGPVTTANGYLPYPLGPARHPRAVQRGSVQYLSVYPGDPGTPGRPAYANVTRDEGWEWEGGRGNLPGIVSVPVGWGDGARLLAEAGKGGGAGRVRVLNQVDTKVTPIWNVMAAIPGHIKDEVVMIGNHRDAWVTGAADPVSGTVSMAEVIRAFGAMMEEGWKPVRTILFASWDAEEYSLVGSTEYGEDFAQWIGGEGGRVVAYLNLDMAVSGSRWSVWGSPSLAHLIQRTALDIPHPTQPGKTLWDARDDEGPFKCPGDGDNKTAEIEAVEVAKREVGASAGGRSLATGVEPLGSGSDYTVFLQHLGVASTDQGFFHTPTDAVFHYHSRYDSQRWQEVYVDPGFHRHIAVAKHLGLMALRLADAIVLPLNTTQYALELHSYLDEVEEIAASSLFVVDFSDLRHAITRLVSASIDLDEEKEEAEAHFRDLFRQLARPHMRIYKPGLWYRLKELKSRFKDFVKSLFRPAVAPELKDPAYWMDVAFGTRDVEAGWSLHVKRIQGGAAVGAQHHEAYDKHGSDDPVRKFIKAAKRVRRANQKLVAFERGFISQGGLRDRTWYKHLGVAPGYWLGYGATTLPGLTEALTLDKNATWAEYEASRLTDLLQKMVVQLRP